MNSSASSEPRSYYRREPSVGRRLNSLSPGGGYAFARRGDDFIADLQAHFWDEHEVDVRLQQVMTRAFDDVHGFATEAGVDLREAAHALAVGRLAEAHELRGLYP